MIGVGSNLLVRDGGIPGVTIRLGRGFAEIEAGVDEVSAGAGALDLNVALTAAQAGIAGLEFLSGVPGTIGGALRMNAGAYGGEVRDVLIHAEAIDRDGVDSPTSRHGDGAVLSPLRRRSGVDFHQRGVARATRRSGCRRATDG